MRDLFLLKIYQSRPQPADQRNSYQVLQVPIYGSSPHESKYFLKPHIFFTWIGHGWLSGFTGLMFTEGRFVIKKMFSFRNIQIRVDGALMFNTTCTFCNPTCYEFKIHFPFIFPSSCCFSLVSSLFSLVVGYDFFVCFFLSWFMFLVLSYHGCRVH